MNLLAALFAAASFAPVLTAPAVALSR